MESLRSIGTQIQMSFQTKFHTFTPDQFRSALSERNFSVTNSVMPNPENPQAPTINVQLFSKGNISIVYLPGVNRLIFQILNTLNLSDRYEDIKQILFDLNVVSTVISNIGFACTTAFPSKNNPRKNLTSLINSDFLSSIQEGLGIDMSVTSIRVATSFPLERDAVQVILEPLGTSPDDHYFVSFLYQTVDMEKFNTFISSFGLPLIDSIIQEVDNDE